MNEPSKNENGSQEPERSRRNRTLKKAYLTFQQHASQVPCVIRNISETGAMIELQQHTIVPSRFELLVDLDGYKVECEVVRQNENQVALKFTGEKQNIGATRTQILRASDDPAVKLAEREKELKAIIANQRMRRSVDLERQEKMAPRPRAQSATVFGKR